MRRLILIVFLVCLMTSVAPAAVKWVGGAAGNWNVAANWQDTSDANVYRIPLPTESADIGGIGVVVTVDSSATAVCNLLRLAPAATDDVTLVISDSASSLQIVGTSQETMAVGKAGKGVVNQSAGSVLVSSTNTWGGEMRMTYAGSAYNLSGGTLNVGTIRKNNQSVDAAFNDTGGTIVMKYMYRIGPPSTSNLDMIWNQGASTLEVGGSIGVVQIGQSNYDQKHTTSNGSVIRIELASDASYDYGRASAAANFTDGTLDIVAVGGYVPLIGTTFDVWRTDLKVGLSGTGTFDQITDNLPWFFTAKWVTVSSANDTLRVTYIPEPATVALLGLGALVAVRRQRRK